ncbi:MBL fold metallo-hydrolase RNA specificity domain-containing protein [Psychromonas antarctica]|uniref:MBL fold metallo-hydrolase RNA specificity domain-containing protein n=1 Tax=Psychromonas antarctica TaxID=67573 RepID=UPI001EE7BC23|nr:MBL fold metallo-hydrolase [Psychromonas antarctica]MCG6202122.1 MBL fold metallo-hydrolase [Psychromonas antarctica]
MNLFSHGGAKGVTGSCHELQISPDSSLLIDCGMFQGNESKQIKNQWDIEFAIDKIQAVLITHCHIDHVGRIPALLAAGFTGPIYCTRATALLLPLVIEDAIKVGVTRNPSLIKAVINRLDKQLIGIDYGKWQNITLSKAENSLLVAKKHSLKVKFKQAGHIIGSAYIEIVWSEKGKKTRIVFSGDLGAPYTPLLPAPKSPYQCDWLILESTYGDRQHQGRAVRCQALKNIVERSLQDGGVILIPAFSIGRTQELLYELEEIIYQVGQNKSAAKNKQKCWQDLPIIIDSPLAAHFTAFYRQLKPLWDKEAQQKLKAGRHPLNFDNLITIDEHREHLALVARLQNSNEPAIIIAASGMCSGGRIVNYLQALLSHPQTDVLFVGYQAQGTPGREIQTYGPTGGYVLLDGKRIDINAQIHTLSGYSAHADQSDLVNFVKRMRIKPSKINLVHGELSAKASLAKVLNKITKAKIEWQ